MVPIKMRQSLEELDNTMAERETWLCLLLLAIQSQGDTTTDSN